MDEVKYYNSSITLEEAEQYIQSGLITAARAYVANGYYLHRIREDKLFEEAGYQNFEDYVRGKYNKDKGWASKCIKVNQQLSEGGNSPILSKQYLEYSTYQLVELAYMTEEQREEANPEMTVNKLKQIRKPEETIEPEQSCDVTTSEPEEEQDSLKEKQSPIERGCITGLSPYGVCSCCGQVPLGQETAVIGPDPAPDPETVIDGEYTEIPEEPQEPEYTPRYFLAEQKRKLDEYSCLSAEDRDDPAIRLMEIRQKTIVAALACMVAELERPEPIKPEQPELPLLKNNDQRAAFIDGYETWPLWIETKETGERYYRYDLSDGTSMVVKVYHAMLFDYKAIGKKYEDRYSEGYGKHEYYFLQEGKFFRDCETNRSYLIEKLKELQKKGKGD